MVLKQISLEENQKEELEAYKEHPRETHSQLVERVLIVLRKNPELMKATQGMNASPHEEESNSKVGVGKKLEAPAQ